VTELRRVGLNLLYLVPGETGGTEVYARNLIPRLAEVRPELELVAFVNREGVGLPLRGAAEAVRVDVSGRSRARRVMAERFRLPGLARRHGVQLLHSLDSTGPARPGAASVVTILDLIYASHPEAHTHARRLGMRMLVPRAARRADRVIAISEHTAAEIVELLKVPRERIDVILLGGKPLGPATPEFEIRTRYRLGDAPLILSVSARRPHKNLRRLLAAFARLDTESRPILVLPGYPTVFEGEIKAEAERLGVADRVRWPDWVPDRDLEGLYATATCFAFPSLAEGFGLPVLEAMERGVPVACSSASSLPEVAGDAARYFDPLDEAEMARALEELLERPETRRELASAGRRRAQLFSWERAARETVATYERAWERS
jgi:glycosyltransferase involved in cell wall biosynthesis